MLPSSRAARQAPLTDPAQQTTAYSHHKTLQIRIACGENFVWRAFEIDAAVAVNEESGNGFQPAHRRVRGRRVTHYALGLGIKAKIGQRETVLQSMRGQQRGYAIHVAQAQDQSDDGLRRDRIEPSRRGI